MKIKCSVTGNSAFSLLSVPPIASSHHGRDASVNPSLTRKPFHLGAFNVDWAKQNKKGRGSKEIDGGAMVGELCGGGPPNARVHVTSTFAMPICAHPE